MATLTITQVKTSNGSTKDCRSLAIELARMSPVQRAALVVQVDEQR